MIIQVLQGHIDRGVPKDSCLCPIALAIKDKIGEEELNCYVSVGIGLIAIYKPQTGKYFKGYPTTGKIRRFLRNFDAQIIPVKPFEFELLEENTL